jgi:hypothetical protein
MTAATGVCPGSTSSYLAWWLRRLCIVPDDACDKYVSVARGGLAVFGSGGASLCSCTCPAHRRQLVLASVAELLMCCQRKLLRAFQCASHGCQQLQSHQSLLQHGALRHRLCRPRRRPSKRRHRRRQRRSPGHLPQARAARAASVAFRSSWWPARAWRNHWPMTRCSCLPALRGHLYKPRNSASLRMFTSKHHSRASWPICQRVE